MAGNSRSGRRAKATAPKRQGRPTRPKRLGQDETYFWDEVIAKAEHLEAIDTPLCVALCRAWRLYCDAVTEAQMDPTDSKAKSAVSAYGALLDKLAGRLAIDPLGRARHKPKRSDEAGPLAEFGLG